MDVSSIGTGFPSASMQGFEALVATRLGPEVDASVASLEHERSAKDAADKLEGLFATMLVKEMRTALSQGFFGEGSASDIYGGWFDEHVGAALARDGALNLAGMIKTGLSAKAGAVGDIDEGKRAR